MSINSVHLTGNLTRDPELAATRNGTSVLKFGIAVNDAVKNNQTGEWEKRPNFIDCTMFGARAEAVNKYLHKGSKVSLTGRLHWSQWTDQNGGKRSKLDVTVNEIEFMSQASPNQGAQSPAEPYVDASIYQEDIPF